MTDDLTLPWTTLLRRRRRADRANAAVYYVLLAAFILAVAGQVAVPQSLPAEPDARRRLVPPSPDDGQTPRRARSTDGISRLLGNSTNGKYTISAIEKRRAEVPQELTLTGDVVTAPLQPRGSTGVSSRTQSRNLEDYELEDIVLLGTIDGSIHACDRKTGREKWSLDFPDNPMIETINYPRNRSTESDSTSDDDYIFIVEPSRVGTGNIYVQSRNPAKGLRKLPETVQDLAFAKPHDIPGTRYSHIAKHQSSLFTIDATTGSVLKRLDLSNPFLNPNRDRSCPRVDPFNGDGQECEPLRTIVLGRMDYTIHITDRDTSDDLCTIRYAEWTINSRDTELQVQHDATPLERRQIFSFSNGQIMGMESVDDYGGPRFRAKFDSPVTQVFDVARPSDAKDTSASLVILSQPLILPQDARSLDLYEGIPRDRTKVFVNKTAQGSYFLMSEEHYPFSTSTGPWSPLFQGIDTERTYIDFDSEEDDMTGVHRLVQTTHYTPLLDAPPRHEAVKQLVPIQDGEIIPVASSGPGRGPQLAYLGFGLVTIIVILAWFFRSLRQGSEFARAILELIEQCTGLRIQYRSVKESARIPNAEAQAKKTDESNGNAPQGDGQSYEKDSKQVSAESITTLPGTDGAENSLESKHFPQESRKSSSDGNSADWEKVSVEPLMTEVGMLPISAQDGDSEGEGLSHEEQLGEEPQPGKRNRTLPRKRGGKKNKKKPAKTMDDNLDSLAQILKDDETATAQPVHPVFLDGQAAMADPAFTPEFQLASGMTQVGIITVDTRMSNRLGDGSNGTIVFPGTFGARAVAVKRLVRSPKNFAAAEIKHLQNLDSHPNVVRFLCVQESQNFTWIALDLFTTSLDQIVEHPEQYLDLVPTAGLDVNDVLCQVARGVEHLHLHRVVHRDIKPQNVLVRPLKPGRQPTSGGPNLLVVLSDFGLCKLLDDGPGSAFALTGNHTAAGTTGWKAPELLASGPSAFVAVDNGSSGASNPTSTSSEADGFPGQRLRRPGKAIDIFSMGCLFFYVMTQGKHPFDHGGSYARDFNIKENKPNTKDLLSFYSYTYEADDLILQMISNEPQHRPSATQVLQHPHFWPAERKLQFLCDVSDCYESQKVAQVSKETASKVLCPSRELDALEAKRDFVWTGNDFLKRLPPRIIAEAGKQRKYTGSRMIDLLRLIRNKKNHFHDLPVEIKFGEMDGTLEGYYRFWSSKFPSLLVNIHCLLIEQGLKDNPEFMELKKYFD